MENTTRRAATARLLPSLAVALAASAAGALAAPGEAAAQQLFRARDVFVSAPSGTTVYATRTVRFRCRPGDVAAIVSPRNPSGVIVDNRLTYDGANLCSGLPGSVDNSCFAQNFSVVPGTPANTAYRGVGAVTFTPTTGVHTFRLEDVGAPGGVGANNRLVLRTSCRVRFLRNPRPAGTKGD